MTQQDTIELADRLFAAIEAGDTATVAALYAPDVKVWHNYDQIEQERNANLAVLGWMSRKVSGIRYEEIRREVLSDGFLQQHILRGTAPDGSALEVPAILRVYCSDGTVSRIEEYLDTAQVSSLMRKG